MFEIYQIFVTLLLLTLIIGTISGNTLVILAWFARKSLQTPQNSYIVSLAIADLLVGLIVLPMDVVLTFPDRGWTNYFAMDRARFVIVKTLCTVSIFHLIAIAWDRYRTVAYELEYLRRRTTNSVLKVVIFIWILAFWIAFQPVFVIIMQADIALSVDMSGPWLLPFSVSGFILPTLLMIALYIAVFKIIRERLEMKRPKLYHCTAYDRDSSNEIETNEERGERTCCESSACKEALGLDTR
jgi:5-hydroxytryptamine receptor 2